VARRKAISPVIATVIIVAVTIAVAIAVAFWMTGIIGLFTGVEKIEIVSIAVTPPDQNNPNWQVAIIVRNTGTVPVTIDTVLINGQPAAQLQNNNLQPNQNICPAIGNIQGTVNYPPGVQDQINFELTPNANCAGATLTPGLSIEIRLHSTGGKEYPKLVVLP